MIAEITKAEDAGLCNDGGKWVAICETHATSINAKTKKALIGIDTTEFCECCTGNCFDYCNTCEVVGA